MNNFTNKATSKIIGTSKGVLKISNNKSKNRFIAGIS